MFYTELVKQAAEIAGIAATRGSGMDGAAAQKAFEVLQTSMLALNSDDRLTFATEDISLSLHRPMLVLTPDRDYEAGEGEQVLATNYPLETAPEYVIGDGFRKLDKVQYEDYLARYIGERYIYAMRVEFNKATLHFRYSGELKIGLKKPLDMPELITDEAKLIGSALNLLKYKLAIELCVVYNLEASADLQQKYGEQIRRHAQAKTSIVSPPVLGKRRY
ncbi:MAG: hypothetical protein LBH25_09590 [Fibromonadaceae bacterium]|jgi:hypothetical protein|nr:hypothetical protein [Fibromonadaceae bacterium]